MTCFMRKASALRPSVRHIEGGAIMFRGVFSAISDPGQSLGLTQAMAQA